MTATPHVESAGNRIILHFDKLDQALRLMQPWPGDKLRADAAIRITKALEAVGLIVEVRVNGRPIAEMGAGGVHGSLMKLIAATL